MFSLPNVFRWADGVGDFHSTLDSHAATAVRCSAVGFYGVLRDVVAVSYARTQKSGATEGMVSP